jgi:two-component system NtrC family response regulator
MPALRERKDDIALLADHFLQKFAPAKTSLSPDAVRALENHAWPGNVRELQNLIERLAVLQKGRVIQRKDLPPEIAGAPAEEAMPASLFEAEKKMIAAALARARGNRSAAARELGVPRHVLLYRLKKFGIK